MGTRLAGFAREACVFCFFFSWHLNREQEQKIQTAWTSNNSENRSLVGHIHVLNRHKKGEFTCSMQNTQERRTDFIQGICNIHQCVVPAIEHSLDSYLRRIYEKANNNSALTAAETPHRLLHFVFWSAFRGTYVLHETRMERKNALEQ